MAEAHCSAGLSPLRDLSNLSMPVHALHFLSRMEPFSRLPEQFLRDSFPFCARAIPVRIRAIGTSRIGAELVSSLYTPHYAECRSDTSMRLATRLMSSREKDVILLRSPFGG